MYISIDGPDFVGKTTIVNRLKIELEHCRSPIYFTRQPGDVNSPICKVLRELVLNDKYHMDYFTTELLFIADIAENITTRVMPYPNVITDRGLLTHYAYVYARGILTEFLGNAYLQAHRGMIPFVTYLIKCDPEIIKERRKKVKPEFTDGKDKVESEDAEFHAKVSDYFDYIEKASKVGEFKLFGTNKYYNNVHPISNNGDIEDTVAEIIFDIKLSLKLSNLYY